MRNFETAPTGDITVLLASGTYRLTSPLTFGAADGGQASSTVTWAAAPGAQPLLTGSTAVTGWSVYNSASNIYVADTLVGVDTRQLYVNGSPASRASIPIASTDVTITATGLTINNSALNYLSGLPQQNRIELQGLGTWTDRYSPVSSISGTTVTMTQPAWNNNTWGWDTLQDSFAPEVLTLENSLSFLQTEGQWFIDPTAGKLYYKPASGVNPSSLNVELPRLQSLVNIGGTYAAPVNHLVFQGIRFEGTSWLAPSSANGYADQQNGTFSTGEFSYRPADAFTSCSRGCATFERGRTTWSQIPAAIQVSAANNVTFTGNTFNDLGQTALGIGMDANAHATGVGLGASDINVLGNTYTNISGSAVVAGGIAADAHHPSDQRMLDQNILIQNNSISTVGTDYKDASGILTTYVTNARILHNEVTNVPYDAIDTGWGWGINDAGGSPDYDGRGYYQYNPKYWTQTTLANNVVGYNMVHHTKTKLHDGGSIYNLSASPGTVYRNNYIYDLGGTRGLYLDEGSRFMFLTNNVVQDAGDWIFANTGFNNTKDNVLDNTYHNSGNVAGDWSGSATFHNTITNDHTVTGTAWPAAAQTIICEAGVAPALRTTLNANYSSSGTYASCGSTSGSVSAPFSTTATSANSSYFNQVDGGFALSAAAADVWKGGSQNNDAYGAIYQAAAVSSGTSVTARVNSQNDTNPWAKTGVMIRNNIAQPGQSAGYAIMAVTPKNGLVFEWDSNGDGYVDSESKVVLDTSRPVWLRLTRSGSQISAYYSFDGTTYAQLGTAVTLPGIAATQGGGIFTTSHDTTQAQTNFVDHLQITTNVAAGLSTFATRSASVSQNGSTISIGGNGTDIWQGGNQHDDAYAALYQPGSMSSGKSVTVKVSAQTDSNAWAKAGVMIRNSISQPGSSTGYAILAVTPGNGVVLEWDSDGNGYVDSQQQINVATNAPIWVRLTRSGSQVTGYYSTDGITFTAVGAALTLPGGSTNQDAGAFATSHDPSTFAVNTLSGLTIG
ncbi:right-handed parallel beta-helix repeat-containing protein [Arthrobacter sp. MI7-26]|uniref:right-handed parallel beta-helix repeat-containing protein n=1 Tax=Arthrobacter sp. MI7-26 TaxID=2993653 RepID=UPI0022490F9F|nr:right-handed parallel beta-helix repeat-containing protein [Arthrobacter sp. MI7-26]MCX2748747.1 right-handed parallel beta-helix repeat-containing protein [Arthrobacter sp. MI7-26]